MKYRKGGNAAATEPDDDATMKEGHDVPPSIKVDIGECHGGGIGNGDGGSASLFEPRPEETPRVWHVPDVSLLPYTGRLFVSKNIGRLFTWLQVLSALACVALSVMRLWRHDFGDQPNKRPALLLFYTLALIEALIFLLEQAYWVWMFSGQKLPGTVSRECELGECGQVSLPRFFFDAYSRCITGSIFDGINMDLVTFAEELILSEFPEEQRIGVRILQRLTAGGSTLDTVRKVGTNARSIERLVEMINWKSPEEEVVRWCAAEVLSKLADKRRNALRVSGIPGAIESVMSLLYTDESAPDSAAPHDVSPAARSYDHQQFKLLGLLILKRIARDHDNCGKIGNTRGLLSKIIELTDASPELLHNTRAPESPVRIVRRALKVVKILVSATSSTGKMLRQEVADNVFTVSNLRGVLQHGQQHTALQKLATEILSRLAMDAKGKQVIVGTGGVVKLLLSIFVNGEKELGAEAGEALAMLALESQASCAAILKQDDVLDHLMSALEGDGGPRRLNAARVLRNLCAYAGEKHRRRLSTVTKAMPMVLKATMTGSERTLEVFVGLTVQICKFIDGVRFAGELRGAGIDERSYVERLASILREHRYPDITVPRMRRFVVQQAIWLMTSSSAAAYVSLLREAGMERLLESIADTTSELECYHAFSGSVGISKHRESFSAAVDAALELLGGDGARAEA
uniref:ARM repeat superfamily protein n=1 Tax=Oryza barthii TaxID=65489 RepID=A0A0D3FIR6_9ORYZ